MDNLELIIKGAEAVLWLDRKTDTVIKDRIAKKYRLTDLDERIRNHRTKAESKILKKAAQLEINVPKIHTTEKTRIIMEHIGGNQVKKIIRKSNLKDIMPKIGSLAAQLHRSDIIHGDLTTSNLIEKEGKIYVLDFGLGSISNSVEKKAVDIRLFEETFASTHRELSETGMRLFFESYEKNYPDAEKIIERLKKVESRGRYIKRKED